MGERDQEAAGKTDGQGDSDAGGERGRRVAYTGEWNIGARLTPV